MIISWDDANPAVKKDWDILQNEILYSNDKLKHNYIAINPHDFYDFNLVVTSYNEIEAFAGVAEKPFWNGFKRIASRLYIRPKYRKQSEKGSALDQYTKDTSYTAILLDYQLSKFTDDLTFISRECTFRSFSKFIQKLNLSERLNVIDSLFKVCGPENLDKSCIQRIATPVKHLDYIGNLDHLKHE